MATIKRQLQLLLPGVSIFLDVDGDLKSVAELEQYVRKSATMLVLLGSDRYFASTNCMRELAAAKAANLRLVLVHDADEQKGGSQLERCDHL